MASASIQHRQPRITLELDSAAEARFFAHRSGRRLGSLTPTTAVSSTLPRQPEQQQQQPRRSSRGPQAVTATAAEAEVLQRRQFLSLAGRSATDVTVEKSQSPTTQSPHSRRIVASGGLAELFLKPTTPVSVSRDLRGSLLAFERSDLLVRSFWMPESNLLDAETKAAKDESAPLFKQRDMQQLTESGSGSGSVRGTSGCVVTGRVAGPRARVGQNGRPLNLRTAWSDTPELRAQRRLSYHAMRRAAAAAAATTSSAAADAVHLSWASQLLDPAVKIIDTTCRDGVATSPTTRQLPPTAAAATAPVVTAAAAAASDRVGADTDGPPRSPLKASAMFHCRRHSRALGSRLVSEEEPDGGQRLPVQLGELLHCMQQRQQEDQQPSISIRSIFHGRHQTTGQSSDAIAAQKQQQQQQQQVVQPAKVQETAVAMRKVGETMKIDEAEERPQPPSRQPPQPPPAPPRPPATSTVKAKSGRGGKRVAAGRSQLSKSAPSKAAAGHGPVGNGLQATFVPIVRPLTTRRPPQPPPPPAPAAPSPATAHAADQSSRRRHHHPSNPLPSTPKESPQPQRRRRPSATAAAGDIRVPMMADAEADGAAAAVASRTSLTSTTHVGDFGDDDDDY